MTSMLSNTYATHENLHGQRKNLIRYENYGNQNPNRRTNE
jgi:hypothetical protein